VTSDLPKNHRPVWLNGGRKLHVHFN